MALLELNGVSKGYGIPGPDRSEILAGIDLTIQEGEFVSIVGYSGSGKTTLINLIAGLISPDVGSINFKGQPVKSAGPERAVVFQNYSLLPWLTVFGNVALAVDQLFPKYNAKEREEHVMKYISMVNLAPARDKYPAELSGGMQKRVGLARAIAAEPEVIFFDEPTTGLDPIMAGVINDLIREIVVEMGATAMTITHDMSSVRAIADEVAMLHEGVIQWSGPIADIDHSGDPYLDQFIHGRAEGPIEAIR